MDQQNLNKNHLSNFKFSFTLIYIFVYMRGLELMSRPEDNVRGGGGEGGLILFTM